MGIYYNTVDIKDAETIEKGIESGLLTVVVKNNMDPVIIIYFNNDFDESFKIWELDPNGNIYIKDFGWGKLTKIGELWVMNQYANPIIDYDEGSV